MRSELPGPPVDRSPGTVRRVLQVLALYLLIVVVIAVDVRGSRNFPAVGSVAEFDVRSPIALRVVDRGETERRRSEVLGAVTPVFRFDDRALPDTLDVCKRLFVRVRDLRTGQIRSAADAIRPFVTGTTGEVLSQGQQALFWAAEAVTGMSAAEVDEAEAAARGLFTRFLAPRPAANITPGLSGLRAEDVEAATRLAAFRLDTDRSSPHARALALAVFSFLIRPTLVVDREATEVRREEARSRVPETYVEYARGEIVVREGQVVRPENAEIFRALERENPGNRPLWNFVGACGITLIALVILVTYLQQYRPEILGSGRLMTLLWLLVLLVVFAAKALAVARILHGGGGASEASAISSYLVPTAGAVILTALLIERNLALFLNVVLGALVFAILGKSSIEFVLVSMVSGSFAVLGIRQGNQRTDLALAGLAVSGSNVFLITAFTLFSVSPIDAGLPVRDWIREAGYGFGNGLLCAVLAMLLLPVLESLFRVTTSMKLLRQVDLNAPLLRRLFIEAPGTYHHSMIVGGMAEAAARAIGADALLAKAGGYYHDIGKLRRPRDFPENRGPRESSPDLAPVLQAMVIKSHLRTGLEIGREERLPKEVLDILEEHHGTNLLAYLYYRQTEEGAFDEEAPPVEAGEEKFRFPGPKPRTRESAIVLLANVAEGACRNLDRPNSAEVHSLVRKVTHEQFAEGQLDDCPLTLRDLDHVNNAFVKSLLPLLRIRGEAEPEGTTDAEPEAPGARRAPGDGAVEGS